MKRNQLIENLNDQATNRQYLRKKYSRYVEALEVKCPHCDTIQPPSWQLVGYAGCVNRDWKHDGYAGFVTIKIFDCIKCGHRFKDVTDKFDLENLEHTKKPKKSDLEILRRHADKK